MGPLPMNISGSTGPIQGATDNGIFSFQPNFAPVTIGGSSAAINPLYVLAGVVLVAVLLLKD